MTAFGDLDVSVIDQLPPGRHPIHTKMTVAVNREEVYQFVAGRLKAGEQALEEKRQALQGAGVELERAAQAGAQRATAEENTAVPRAKARGFISPALR